MIRSADLHRNQTSQATLATYAHLQVDPLLNICVFGESVAPWRGLENARTGSDFFKHRIFVLMGACKALYKSFVLMGAFDGGMQDPIKNAPIKHRQCLGILLHSHAPTTSSAPNESLSRGVESFPGQ